jgi:hypothetical protein
MKLVNNNIRGVYHNPNNMKSFRAMASTPNTITISGCCVLKHSETPITAWENMLE